MAIFRSSPSQASALQAPPAKRISLPVQERLSTITEGPRPPAASRVTQSRPLSGRYAPSFTNFNRWSTGNNSQATTTRTAPPAYGWVEEPIEPEEDLRGPVEGEKLAQLRKADDQRRDAGSKRTRGGWGRLMLIIAAVLIILGIALGVGLGVGLKKHHNNSDSNNTGDAEGSSSQTTTTSQPFPLGEYSLATVLRVQNTSCTSNAATWRCYPYTTYDASSGATSNASMATFNWILTNTSATFPTNKTNDLTTSDQGIPSNLTISSVDNPFAISFTNQSLTYIRTSSNASLARLTFSFEMSKSVLPSASLTSNNAATLCFFNATMFTGTLYLAAEAVFPTLAMAEEDAVGSTGSSAWPYAVEITQSSPAGTDVPACYLTTNGDVGARILTGPAPVSGDEECVCDYRNY